ncbi:MAG TPA: signal peptidase I [Chitinivibrionales bacterium]|nr:signal peptidase I [Chitinivibrionales bacterium]
MQKKKAYFPRRFKKNDALSGKRFLSVVLFGVAVALVLRAFIVDIIQVTSGSMQPTVNLGVRYLLNKTAYWFGKPRRNDIIAFPSPVLKGHSLVKRVIAIEGDTIEIKKKEVFINDVKTKEPFAYHSRDTVILVGDNLGPLEIPKDMVFVMGDNRDESEDSRDWKDGNGAHIYFIPVSKIMGRIILLH